ncbi:phosphopantetheine-binding protein [Hydrogenophaga palleronii]|uniref:phosphopantetheine-binding protein n=1 Tax=Hydrogenophaga palleronii TaxID=65655 RepID=UPI000A049653|nr:phosphopantetheine-binding protein [Hydrogenophaga palleronii]
MNTPNTSAAPHSLEALHAQIARAVNEDPSEIGLDDDLQDWGLDSLRLLNLVITWNEAGLQLDMSELAGQLTLNALWKVVSERQARA